MKHNHNRVESIFEYHSGLISEIDSLKEQTDIDWEKLNGEDLTVWKGIQLSATSLNSLSTGNTLA